MMPNGCVAAQIDMESFYALHSQGPLSNNKGFKLTFNLCWTGKKTIVLLIDALAEINHEPWSIIIITIILYIQKVNCYFNISSLLPQLQIRFKVLSSLVVWCKQGNSSLSTDVLDIHPFFMHTPHVCA